METRRLAPELSGGHEWLNVQKPLTLADLRGKIVLLDFWTYCCINCMHVIPALRYLEEKYREQLVVIGVHAAKFRNERSAANIRQAMWRYGIQHPVVNDRDLRIWRAFDINAWPSFVLIDELGRVVIRLAGEGQQELLEVMIERLIERGRAEGTLQEGAFSAWTPEPSPITPLLYPGKVLADPENRRLFISDSSHHRLVIARYSGEILSVVGQGTPGWEDGPVETARFSNPQGLALQDEVLYVADTDNHLIRALDLTSGLVTAVSGTGKQGYFRSGGLSREVSLNSPWDLAWNGGLLFVAMAGDHQIWSWDPRRELVEPFAGSGQEDIQDGPRTQAKMAQPSGLAFDGEFLYSSDSETSSIRRVELHPGGWVRSLVGKGLFVSGDNDGIGERVRLQHPLGIAAFDGMLYLADTYNHKIKRLDPVRQEVVSLFGTGSPGFEDGSLGAFYEPGGLSVDRETIFVADTNNHAIRVIDAQGVRTLELSGLTPPSQA